MKSLEAGREMPAAFAVRKSAPAATKTAVPALKRRDSRRFTAETAPDGFACVRSSRTGGCHRAEQNDAAASPSKLSAAARRALRPACGLPDRSATSFEVMRQ